MGSPVVTITPDNAPVTITPDVEKATGESAIAARPSREQRNTDEFFSGLISKATGLAETQHPILDAIKSQVSSAIPTSAKDLAMKAVYGPLPGLIGSIHDALSEFKGKQEGETDEDVEARHSHAVGSAIGMVLPLTLAGRENIGFPGATPEDAALAAKAKASIPQRVGAALRDPDTNAVKPGVQVGFRIAGATAGGTAGHLLGLPGIGEFGGYLLSKELADAVIPDHPDYLAKQKYAEIAGMEKTRQQELGQLGRLRTMNERAQALAAKNVTQPSPFAGMTSTSPASVSQLSTAQAVPEVRTTPFGPQPPALLAERFVKPAQPGAEPLVKTPEQILEEERLQRIAEDLARRRGMQYAGGVRTAGPNLPVNRLFP